MIFHSLFLDFSLRAELPNSPKKALPQRIFLRASKLSERGPCTSGSAVGFPAPRLRAPLQPQFGKSQTRKFTLATALGFPKLRLGLQKIRGSQTAFGAESDGSRNSKFCWQASFATAQVGQFQPRKFALTAALGFPKLCLGLQKKSRLPEPKRPAGTAP